VRIKRRREGMRDKEDEGKNKCSGDKKEDEGRKKGSKDKREECMREEG